MHDFMPRLSRKGLSPQMCAAQNPPIRGLEHIPKSYPRHRKNPALKRSPGFFRHHFGILGYALRELCFLILRAENKKLKRKKAKKQKSWALNERSAFCRHEIGAISKRNC
jgi:hypothetical protein